MLSLFYTSTDIKPHQRAIEQKILKWSQILEQYEGQDQTCQELREIISTSQSALDGAKSTMDSAQNLAKTAEAKLQRHEQSLTTAKQYIDDGTNTMAALELFMQREQVVQKNIGRWQSAMLGTGTALSIILITLLAWLLSRSR